MKKFRLARILELRERQARIEELAWAAKERAAVVAATRRDDARRAVEAGYAATREGRAGAPPAQSSPAAILLAYERVDALHERAREAAGALDGARRAALEARAPYDERRRAVEALRRLEDKWKRESRRDRRRKESRSQDATVAARSAREPSPFDITTQSITSQAKTR